jgi:hypothetical protein
VKTTIPPETKPTSIHNPSEREKEILAELGFGEKPVAQTVSVPAAAPKGNGSNGSNGKPQPAQQVASPNGKRPISWNANIVTAVLKAKLAANPVEAVRLLNESGLDANVTPEQAVERIKAQRKS